MKGFEILVVVFGVLLASAFGPVDASAGEPEVRPVRQMAGYGATVWGQSSKTVARIVFPRGFVVDGNDVFFERQHVGMIGPNHVAVIGETDEAKSLTTYLFVDDRLFRATVGFITDDESGVTPREKRAPRGRRRRIPTAPMQWEHVQYKRMTQRLTEKFGQPKSASLFGLFAHPTWTLEGTTIVLLPMAIDGAVPHVRTHMTIVYAASDSALKRDGPAPR